MSPATTLNLQAFGWYLFADFLALGAFKIYAPDFLTTQNIVVLLASSFVLWLLFDRKKRPPQRRLNRRR